MSATSFTTWSALYTAMLNAAADFFTNKMGVAEYTLETSGGSRRTFKYRTVAEFKAGLEFVKSMADTESTSSAPAGRTFAKQGGGGRW
jgi:hypothetical protein